MGYLLGVLPKNYFKNKRLFLYKRQQKLVGKNLLPLLLSRMEASVIGSSRVAISVTLAPMAFAKAGSS